MAKTNQRMGAKQVKATREAQMKADKDAIEYQTQNIEDYKNIIEQTKKTSEKLSLSIEEAEKDVSDTEQVLEIIQEDGAFDLVDGAMIKYAFERNPHYIKLERDNRIDKMTRNIRRLHDQIEEMKQGIIRCEEKVEKTEEDIANAERIIAEAKARLGE